MQTITIPKRITKGEELVVIPRKAYEEFLGTHKLIPVVKMTPAERREWGQAKKDYERGKYVTLEEVQHELGLTRKRKG